MTPAWPDAVHAELAYLRQLLTEYAARHPKIAGRLRIGPDGSSDPALRRLLQAFAFLMARTQRRIDDAFPQLLRPLLDLTRRAAPARIPPLTTVQFQVNPEQPPGPVGAVVPRGTLLDTEDLSGVSGRLRTCADVRLWPLEISRVTVVYPPFTNAAPTVAAATCAVRLSLQTLASNVTFADIRLERLRFHVHAPRDEALRVHDALFSGILDVAVTAPGVAPIWLGPAALQPAGFEADERLFDGGDDDVTRLLIEFLSFPEKFLQFDLHDIPQALRRVSQTEVDIELFLSHAEPAVRRVVPEALRMNCCAAINLFSRDTTPVGIDEPIDQVSLEADARFPEAYEVHSVDRVVVRSPQDLGNELPGFHGLAPVSTSDAAGIRWDYDLREHRAAEARRGRVDLCFVDEQFSPVKLEDCAVSATVTCSNGDLLQQLPFSEPGPLLYVESLAMVSECRCLSPPTRARTMSLADAGWSTLGERLPDVLTLTGAHAAAALRAAAQLCASDDDPLLQGLLASVIDVSLERSTGIVADRMMCHGVDVTVTMRRDPPRPGQLLFLRVLQAWLSRTATDGAFFRLRAVSENGEEFVQWPMRNGARFVI
jgi:type VI secretion system protein ImpG